MSRAGVVLTVVAVAAVAGGVWWLQQSTDGAGDGPAPVPVGDGEPIVPRNPSLPREITLAAPPPKEAVESADDRRIVVPTEWPDGLRVEVPDVPPSLMVRGEKLRDALVATAPLYVRWSSDAVRDAFLKARIKLPPHLLALPADAPPEARGVPLATIVGLIERAGYSARLEPPVLRISEAAPPLPPPDQSTPR